MDDRIASVLEDAFPDREVTDLLSTGPSWNQKNRTVDIEFADGERIYLKVATDRDSSRIARERAVLAYMGANTDVPVPDVVASGPEWSIPYLVTALVAGPNLIELWTDASSRSVRSLRGALRSGARDHRGEPRPTGRSAGRALSR